MRVLGIDYGAKRIGLAVGDTITAIATPWGILESLEEENVFTTLQELITQEEIEWIVVGVPYPFSDSARENNQIRTIRRFIERLSVLGLPIEEEAEALSSKLAQRTVGQETGKRRIDDVAASLVLETWLLKRANFC